MDWRGYLIGQGHDQARLLGQGMEGVVYGLGDAQVAKVWHSRKWGEVRRLAAFHAHLATQELPFRTPEFLDVHEHAGQVVSVERELSGVSLRDAMSSGAVSPDRGKDWCRTGAAWWCTATWFRPTFSSTTVAQSPRSSTGGF